MPTSTRCWRPGRSMRTTTSRPRRMDLSPSPRSRPPADPAVVDRVQKDHPDPSLREAGLGGEVPGAHVAQRVALEQGDRRADRGGSTSRVCGGSGRRRREAGVAARVADRTSAPSCRKACGRRTPVPSWPFGPCHRAPLTEAPRSAPAAQSSPRPPWPVRWRGGASPSSATRPSRWAALPDPAAVAEPWRAPGEPLEAHHLGEGSSRRARCRLGSDQISRSASAHHAGGAGIGSGAGLECEGPWTGGAESFDLRLAGDDRLRRSR